MEWLRPLAEWSSGESAEAQAAAVRARAASAVLDWFGALYAGAASPLSERYCGAVRRLSGADTLPLPEAAWLLAALSHIEEIDDGHRLAMLHPGVVVMPAIFPMLQPGRESTIGEILTAITVGYECAVRTGAALGPEHYKRYHSSATAGCFGAAAAAGKMMGLSVEQLMWAFGHAGTQAAGLWQILDDGAEEAKAAHIGYAVRNGLFAASLASEGIPGATRILEGERGMAASAGLQADRAKLVPPAVPDETALATATMKFWPVCGQIHHILDAVALLVRDRNIRPDTIQSVTIRSFEATKRVAGITEPETIAQARFSTTFCVALLIVAGRLDLSVLKPEVLGGEDIRALAARVNVVADDALTARFPAERACHVAISFSNGETFEIAHEGRRGDAEQPLSAQEMEERFDAAAYKQSPAQRVAVREFVGRLAEDDWASPVREADVASLLAAAASKQGIEA
ncbi:MmgE/PrpD family protein [Chelativorans sp. YIM 93263]|uniref:MmgE/PrpD family protein n=1 Tax=Chelativorans sp. YIM 93263 TaxID=2906648 RepID=UPI002378F895|nr:MmgE/PrpD family protein [Chelativorans sp. YIM 93263]